MKKKIYYALIILFILIAGISYKFSTNILSRENDSMNINIPEKIVLSLGIAKNGLISNDSRNFFYNFQQGKLSIETSGIYIKNLYLKEFYSGKINIDNNKYLNDGVLYIDGKKVYKCNVEYCSFYKSENGEYIVFVDKMVYNTGFIKKEFAFNILRVLNLETLEYKNIPSLNYNGDNFSVNEILGYVK